LRDGEDLDLSPEENPFRRSEKDYGIHSFLHWRKGHMVLIGLSILNFIEYLRSKVGVRG